MSLIKKLVFLLFFILYFHGCSTFYTAKHSQIRFKTDNTKKEYDIVKSKSIEEKTFYITLRTRVEYIRDAYSEVQEVYFVAKISENNEKTYFFEYVFHSKKLLTIKGIKLTINNSTYSLEDDSPIVNTSLPGKIMAVYKFPLTEEILQKMKNSIRMSIIIKKEITFSHDIIAQIKDFIKKTEELTYEHILEY